MRALADRVLGAGEDGGEGRLVHLGRRYFPVALGAACLAMIVGFFPSTLPAGLGALLPAPLAAPSSPGLSSPASSPVAPVGPGPSLPPLDAGSIGLFSSPSPSAAPVSVVGPGPDQTAPAPSAVCPISLPTTATQANAVLAEIESLCLTAVSELGSLPLSGSVPLPGGMPSLPSGSLPALSATSGAAASGAGSAGMPLWVALDDDAPPTQGAPSLAAGSTVVLGIVEGTDVPAGLESELSRLRLSGDAVELLLVPRLDELGSSTFALWASRTVTELPAAGAVGLVVGAVPTGSVEALAGALSGATSEIRRADASADVGWWWADGGLSPADDVLWSTLAAQHEEPAFDVASVAAASVCSAGPALAANVERYQAGALGPPVAVEGLPGTAGTACAATGGRNVVSTRWRRQLG